MIEYGEYKDLGETLKYLSIDLSDKKHQNRIIDIVQISNPFKQEFEYKIKAQWTPDKFHPTMHLSLAELEEFSRKLNKMISDVKSDSTDLSN